MVDGCLNGWRASTYKKYISSDEYHTWYDLLDVQ